jgi:putative ABC transport system substrate-binding protein
MNNRRRLIIALGAGALAAPFASIAQESGKVWRVGYLSQGSRPVSFDPSSVGAFLQGMRDLGYVEGKNLVMEWRFADNSHERLSGLAAELVQLKVNLIVAVSPPATSAAQKATTTIPIVFGGIGDPVGIGFVKSLAHPGGNITGISNQAPDIGSKQLEMLRDMVPNLARVAVLTNPMNSGNSPLQNIVEAAAQKVRVKVLPLEARTPQEIGKAFSEMARQKAGAVIVARDPFLNQQLRQIAELAAKNRLPAISGIREYVEAGGLVSYGASLTDMWRRVATHADKILKGAKPGDLPVEQPTKFELFINGKTAKALGLKIPHSLLIGADKVIE